jgi:hypothetical protein
MADPNITFGAAQLFGTVAGWGEQSSSSDVKNELAQALDKLGNIIVQQLHSDITEVSTDYEAQQTGATTVLPAAIGATLNSLIVTAINLSTSGVDFAKNSLTGHNHTAAPHTTINSVAHSITLTAGFGATDFFAGTAGDNASVESSTCSITTEHSDISGATGAHIEGENHTFKISATVIWHGVPSSVGGTGWKITSTKTDTDNNGFLKTTVTGEKALVYTP